MPFQALQIRPGINQQATPALNAGGYSSGFGVRFKDSLAEKEGGWQALTTTPLIGTARGSHVWSDLAGNPYYAAGTEQRLEVLEGGTLLDITPLRATDNVAVALTTAIGSMSVTVHDPANGVNVGDWVDIVIRISVGGITIQGFYQVQTVIDADNYTITVANAPTANVAAGGAVSVFASTAGSPNIQVTLASHGLVAGDLFTVHVSTTISTVVILGTFPVAAPVTANTFFIAPGGNAVGIATVAENGGNAQYQYLIPTGLVSAAASVGYGAGDYGGGDYGGGASSTTFLPVRQWFLDNFGQDLIAQYTNGPLYYWVPPTIAPATLVPNGPLAMTASFIAMPEQMIVALGAEVLGTQDPNLVRWCDAGDFTVWNATALNQAGSFRIPTGSRIVGGIQAPNKALIWTDIDLWSMEYVQPPFVWGFNKVAVECGLIAAQAVGVIGNIVVWMGTRNFYIMDQGGVNVLPCTLWDAVYKNLNLQQSDKIFCAVNSLFNEITFYYPSAAGTGEIDLFVRYNTLDKVWLPGNYVRTTWADESALGAPIGVDLAGILQHHDLPGVYDANGLALDAFWQTGYFLLAQGTEFIFLERMVPDFVWIPTPVMTWLESASAELTVYMTDYPAPGIPVRTYGPFKITPYSKYIIVRGRGRYLAFKVQTKGVGVFLRTGQILYLGQPAGRT